MRRLVFLAALSALPLLDAAQVRACSCVQTDPQQALVHAAAVFEGEVVEVSRVGEQLHAVFRVTQYWKGDLSEEVGVTTMAAGSLCGVPFEENVHYMVYAEGDDALSTNVCLRTRLADDASEDRTALGAGIVPVDPNAEPPPAMREEDDEQRASSAGCRSCSAAGPDGSFAVLALVLLGLGRRSG